MSKKSLVLDANILIRAVLGRRVLTLIADNAMRVNFFAPDIAWQDARKYLPQLLVKRGVSPAAMATFDLLISFIAPIAYEEYAPFQMAALKRIAKRDADDWPILASAMALNCPVWTEDADFFGSGIGIEAGNESGEQMRAIFRVQIHYFGFDGIQCHCHKSSA
jgi:predicted nucleic acid-binding protein